MHAAVAHVYDATAVRAYIIMHTTVALVYNNADVARTYIMLTSRVYVTHAAVARVYDATVVHAYIIMLMSRARI
jgi:hypothetical protein